MIIFEKSVMIVEKNVTLKKKWRQIWRKIWKLGRVKQLWKKCLTIMKNVNISKEVLQYDFFKFNFFCETLIILKKKYYVFKISVILKKIVIIWIRELQLILKKYDNLEKKNYQFRRRKWHNFLEISDKFEKIYKNVIIF